jgi:hypothetical protein
MVSSWWRSGSKMEKVISVNISFVMSAVNAEKDILMGGGWWAV